MQSYSYQHEILSWKIPLNSIMHKHKKLQSYSKICKKSKANLKKNQPIVYQRLLLNIPKQLKKIVSLEDDDDDSRVLSFKMTKKFNRNNISSIYNEHEIMIHWSDAGTLNNEAETTMDWRWRQIWDDDRSETTMDWRRRHIWDDAEATTD